jgi:hypothetical protein
MKAKISRGGGFRGLLDYALRKDKETEILSTNLSGQTPRELAAEFSAVRQLRPDIEKPVWHCSLSLPANEKASAEEWDHITKRYLEKMGFDAEKTPYVAVRHRDTDYDHAHLVVSRVNLQGEVWHGKWEARRAIEATQELEKEFKLTRTPGLEQGRAQKSLSHKELNRVVRTGEPSHRQRLQGLCDQAAKNCKSFREYSERLKIVGVKVIAVTQQEEKKLSGLSYQQGEVTLKASDLGKSYTAKGLSQRGVIYEREQRKEVEQIGKSEVNRQPIDRAGPTTGREEPGAAHPASRTIEAGQDKGRGRAGTVDRAPVPNVAATDRGHPTDFPLLAARGQERAAAKDKRPRGLSERERSSVAKLPNTNTEINRELQQGRTPGGERSAGVTDSRSSPGVVPLRDGNNGELSRHAVFDRLRAMGVSAEDRKQSANRHREAAAEIEGRTGVPVRPPPEPTREAEQAKTKALEKKAPEKHRKIDIER